MIWVVYHMKHRTIIGREADLMIDECPVDAIHPELQDIRGQLVAELDDLHQIVLERHTDFKVFWGKYNLFCLTSIDLNSGLAWMTFFRPILNRPIYCP